MTIHDWIDIYTGLITIVGIIASIYFLNKTTDRKIKSSNKQFSRPYLRVDKIFTSLEEKPNGVVEVLFDEYDNQNKTKQLDEKILTARPIKLTLTLNNVGLGIARNIRMYNATKEMSVFYEKESNEIPYVKNNNIFVDIAINEQIDVNIFVRYIMEKPSSISPLLKPVSDSCQFIIFYEDINNNLYSSTLRIDILYNLARIHKEDPEYILSYETSMVHDHKNNKIYNTTMHSELDVWLSDVKHLK